MVRQQKVRGRRDVLREYWANARLIIWCAFLIYILARGPARHESGDLNWIIAYLFAGAFFLFLLMALPPWERRGATFETFLKVYPVVYILQVVGYVSYLPFHWSLLIPLMLAAGVAIFVSACLLVGRLRSEAVSKCKVCGDTARFTLVFEPPEGRSAKTDYCFRHFETAIREYLDGYSGQFVIPSPQLTRDTRQGSCTFYAPEDMAMDSYSDSDIEAVESLITACFKEHPGASAIRISDDVVSTISRENDAPFVARTPEPSEMTPMDVVDFIAFIRSESRYFDTKDGKFSISMPYAPKGIYIWHDYI